MAETPGHGGQGPALTLPAMAPVNSTNLLRMGHDGQHAFVEFRNGGIWRYRDVPKSIYDEWLHSGSVGSYLAMFIKKNHTGEKLA